MGPSVLRGIPEILMQDDPSLWVEADQADPERPFGLSSGGDVPPGLHRPSEVIIPPADRHVVNPQAHLSQQELEEIIADGGGAVDGPHHVVEVGIRGVDLPGLVAHGLLVKMPEEGGEPVDGHLFQHAPAGRPLDGGCGPDGGVEVGDDTKY